MKKRIFSMVLVVVMLIGIFPNLIIESNADNVVNLSCADFISTKEHQEYIDLMMRYHLSTNSNLLAALDKGKSVVFMFEGGSDNYPSHKYSTSGSNIRDQAVVIVVQKKNNEIQIVFSCEDCSTIPSQPDEGHATILDAIYGIQTCNHKGYGALYVNTNKAYYSPSSNPDGSVSSASGIDIHTRTSCKAGSGTGAWSAGCLLIGTGSSSSNVFNKFMRVVAGIDFDVWIQYKSNLVKLPENLCYKNVGYLVVDRLLAKDGLSAIYSEKAMSNIMAASQAWYEEAKTSNNHIDTPYRCYGIAEVTSSKAYVKSMPCSRGTDPNSDDVEKPDVGDKYTVLGMVKNTEGKYWYEVARFLDSKPIGYMYAGDVTYYQTSDIVDSNVSIASEIQAGKPITISGTVSSDHQKIVNVHAFVTPRYTNEIVARDPIETNAVTYNLSNISLGKLPVGEYTLYIDVEAKSNFSPDGNTLSSARGQVYGYQADFSVVEEVVCSHSYTSKVTASTTTSQGYTTYTCTKCGHSYKGNYTDALTSQHKITFDPNGGVLPGAYAQNDLDGINVERAAGYLVVYNNSGKLVDTNKYGIEVLVDSNNKVIGKRDYLSETKQTVPNNGFVLSGQGANGTWVGEIAIGHYVAYDESLMKVYVYDTREAFEAHHKQVPDGGEVGLLPTPTREGYTFDGWYTYREGGHKVTEEDCMGSDLTFYAHWVKNSCTNGCSYYGTVKTVPTKNSEGTVLCTCMDCGESFTVVLPTFNTTDYEYGIITEPTCKQVGTAVYGWLNYDYGIFTFDVVVDALGEAGHKYTYAATKKPTETTAGTLTGTCSVCSGTTTVTLPKLNATDYTYKLIKEPSYMATGTGRYTWKTTTYGTFYFDVTLNKLTATLTKIEVAAKPTKTVYEIGESLDTSGLVLKATYSDGSTKTITSGFTTSGFSSTTVGTKTVSVSYGGMSTSFTVTVNAAAEIPAGRITIESVEAKAGDTVSVAVYLENNPGVAYAKFGVEYSDGLTLVSAEDQAVLTGTFTTSQTIGEKPYVLQWMGAENSTKNGCIAILTFRVAEDAKDGAYDITMTCGEAYNAAFEDITFAITNASVAVTSHTPGDVNGDGKANGKDGILLAQYLAGWSAAVHMDAADVNGDGKVNGKDGILMAQYLAGWDVVLG